jgi:hypothetical protein
LRAKANDGLFAPFHFHSQTFEPNCGAQLGQGLQMLTAQLTLNQRFNGFSREK